MADRKQASGDVREVSGPTRREVVVGVGGVAALAVVGGVGRAFAGEGGLLRPPGGQDEDKLIGACIRCDRCRSVCPHDGIGVATVEDGLLAVRTPVMDFHGGYCNGCDGEFRCVKVCPTGALSPFDKTTQKMGIAVIDYKRCEAYGVTTRCKYDCIAWCPEEALWKDDEGYLKLDEDKCWGCGMCVYFCPSNSYRTYDGTSDRGIEVRLVEGGADD